MSNVWFNVRFGIYHIQIEYGNILKTKVSRNPHWCGQWKTNPFAIYDFRLFEGIRRFVGELRAGK